ncbi:hypothetical protein PLICRDRAFT_34741 [Plicaturopsis crispa FD-325 SS-3]|nr:hypothetical protein PLICRDRAFT_34741 [Plicaturopsis crispa FD-325 SS-3]
MRSWLRPSKPAKGADALRAAHVPVSDAPCRACPDPCDQGHDDYPAKFSIDTDAELLGTIKPYNRQIVISTGKSDWAREVTDESGSLAALLHDAASHSKSHSHHHKSASKSTHTKSEPEPELPPGIFPATSASRTSILNGSHHSSGTGETVLVFPDYVAVEDVPRTRAGAEALWGRVVSPGVGRAGAVEGEAGEGGEGGDGETKMWVLPYSCVILLCSHKKRDNRCAIAAPKLEKAFAHALEEHDFAVHTQLEANTPDPIPPLSAFAASSSTPAAPPSDTTPATAHDDASTPAERRAAYITARLHDAAHNERQALVLKCSHVGGHKYAGNCTIYTPRGAGVWYGRVTPHEVPAIVRETVLGGRVLPALLRGGVNLVCEEGEGLAW